jgi:tetratricopeptide (TPR) repeat protein
MKTQGGLRVTVVHLVLLALGGWSVWAQFVYRTPSRYLALVLAGAGAASTGLTVVFWLHALLRGAGARDEQLSLLAVGQKVCALTTLGFCFFSLFLFTNAKFDLADATHHPTEIVRIGMEDTDLGIGVPFDWADVRSWRRPGDVERILLRRDERAQLWGGQAVVVSVRPGYYGVPWVSRIEADVERRSRAILALAPDAAQVRKDLADFYIRVGRFADAAKTTREYTTRFPSDRNFPVHIAGLLITRDRFDDVITVLTDVAPRREDADVYMLLGLSLANQGQRKKGIALLEKARAMQPNHWWPHFTLGLIYAADGNYRAAEASLEKTLQLRPGFWDAEQRLQKLRPLAAQTKTP